MYVYVYVNKCTTFFVFRRPLEIDGLASTCSICMVRVNPRFYVLVLLNLLDKKH